MRKLYLFISVFVLLLLVSCSNTNFSIIKMINGGNGSYNLVVVKDELNLKEYISGDKEYKVNYLNKEYSSNEELVFNLLNGDNIFELNCENKSYTLCFHKKFNCNIIVVDNNLNELDRFEVESLSTIDNSIIDFNKYKKEGYTLSNKIYYSKSLENFIEVDLQDIRVDSNIYLMIEYVPVEYDVNVIIDGHIEKYSFLVGENMNLVTPSKVGYSFDGWYAKEKKIDELIYNVSMGNEIEARFIPNECIIKYQYFDSSYEEISSYDEYFSSNYEYYIPSVEGYEFLKWEEVSKEQIDNVWYVTLKGEFKQSTIKLNLECFGGNVDEDAPINGDEVLLPTPNLSGYKFLGWFADLSFTREVSLLKVSEYDGNTLYAKYSYDSTEVKYEFVYTRFNSHAKAYDELAMFDSSKSGFTSLYWHKLAIRESNGKYYISSIKSSGDSLSTLGEYDYVFLAYSDYDNYKDFVNASYSVGDSVYFLCNPSTLDSGAVYNLVTIVKQDFSEDEVEIKEYLESLYGNVSDACENLDLVSSYNQYLITWKTSNRDCISSTGKFTKPYVTRQVELTACINDEEIFSFTVRAEGEKNESDAIAAGYIYTPYNTITQTAMDQIDIIYCAFLDIDASANFTNTTRMTSNIKNYILPLAQKSGTKVVVSVNQKSSGNFSAVACSAELREKLATNILNFIIDLGLDGIDIDWETPAKAEAANFTLLMKAIYDKVKAYNSSYLVTAAIGGGKWAPPAYDLPNSKNYMDYINLMTYSMASGSGYYQNSLYKSTKGRTLVSCSIEESIKIYNDLGVQNKQILVGIPFYVTVQTESGGPGSYKGNGKSIWYNQMFTTYKLSDTMKEYFDEECGVPYRYDEVNQIFISFDNEQSIKVKCEYVNTLGLAGIMYWQYGQDVNDMLSLALGKYINA